MAAHQMEQDWNNSCTSCCSPFSTCLLSWCIPCITYGRVQHRLHKDAQLKNFSMFNMDCLGYCALSCCTLQWIIQMMQRGEIREKYGLKGNGCTDCLMACCCTPCDLTQQDKEVKGREGEKQAFISQQPAHNEGMHYGAPPTVAVKQEFQQDYHQPADIKQGAYHQPTPQYHDAPAPQHGLAPEYGAIPQYTEFQHNSAPQQYSYAPTHGA